MYATCSAQCLSHGWCSDKHEPILLKPFTFPEHSWKFSKFSRLDCGMAVSVMEKDLNV